MINDGVLSKILIAYNSDNTPQLMALIPLLVEKINSGEVIEVPICSKCSHRTTVMRPVTHILNYYCNRYQEYVGLNDHCIGDKEIRL